jgi:hypothetical protein
LVFVPLQTYEKETRRMSSPIMSCLIGSGISSEGLTFALETEADAKGCNGPELRILKKNAMEMWGRYGKVNRMEILEISLNGTSETLCIKLSADDTSSSKRIFKIV